MNMSQGDLAKAVNVSVQQVQKYEKGANRLSLSMAVVMCTALGWRVMDLVGDLDLEGG